MQTSETTRERLTPPSPRRRERARIKVAAIVFSAALAGVFGAHAVRHTAGAPTVAVAPSAGVPIPDTGPHDAIRDCEPSPDDPGCMLPPDATPAMPPAPASAPIESYAAQD